MEYTDLGNTGLKVSVAGLGCGGNSRVGLGRGASIDECVDIVRTAIDLGVNFLDTAEMTLALAIAERTVPRGFRYPEGRLAVG